MKLEELDDKVIIQVANLKNQNIYRIVDVYIFSHVLIRTVLQIYNLMFFPKRQKNSNMIFSNIFQRLLHSIR